MELRRWLGPPSLRRPDPPAEYWRYSFRDCTLHLFFFRAPGDAEARVVHYELRSNWIGRGREGCDTYERRFGQTRIVEEH